MSRKCNKVNRVAVLVPTLLALGGSAACAGNVGVGVNINIGNPPPVVIPAPVVPLPSPVISIEQDVNFVLPAPLGFYVAVDVPYDLFFVRNNYYLCRDGLWYRAPGSHGPWTATRFRDLPPGLRKHKLERIREYRRAEYAIYRRDRDHYHGRHFVTGREEWRAERRDGKRYRQEAKHEEREYRHEMKRADKEERRGNRGRHDD